jgi:hypothetical protein
MPQQDETQWRTKGNLKKEESGVIREEDDRELNRK